MRSLNHKRISPWQCSATAYKQLITDKKYDSEYLRRVGLQATILGMIGDCADDIVLDVGCGTGWLFEHIRPAKGYAFDITLPAGSKPDGHFTCQNFHNFGYKDESFSLIVASMVLMWTPNLEVVCTELYRVAQPQGGRLIIALPHPYFYRTGQITVEGHYLITASLARPFHLSQLMINNRVGPLDYYYRPLDRYLNTLIQAGWTLRRMRDWFIDLDDYRAHNHTSQTPITRTGHVPLFTFMEWAKL